jgi:hypothetical protein
MKIDECVFKLAMAEEHLDGAQIRTGFQQMCRETMPQGVRNRRFVMPGRFAACRHAAHGTQDVMGTSARQFFAVPGNRYVFGFIQRQ